jgi:ABC-type glycerol-3-phosphate transport system substrate-binding protein
MSFMKLAGLTTAAALASSAAWAGCGISAGNVSILGNDFAPIQALVAAAEECAGDGVTVSANLTTEHRDLQVAALTANPAQYTSAIVANSSIVPLMNDGLIRPLDDLVAAHGAGLNPNQLITIDGKVMAIAFMANAQHLFYRSDILEQVGVEPPTTYEGVLAAAEAIKAAGIMEHPYAMNTAAGWNLGEEFVNMYLGTGADFFEPGTANIAINNENGVAALEMLKALNGYANPDFLTFDSNATAALWEAGDLALATMWGSRAAPILDDEGSTPEIVGATMLAGAPSITEGGATASTLWWDGFTIAANISDEDAEATFIALMNGLTPEKIAMNNDLTVWLAPGYEPAATATGVFATANSGTAPYPMLPYMGLLHTAAGDNLAEFLQGSESAEQALADIEAAYMTAARDQGFVQ